MLLGGRGGGWLARSFFHTNTPSLPPLHTPDNVDLGTACGKLHRVSVLAITDAGDSDILKTTEGVTA